MSLKTNKRTLLQAVNCEDIEGVTELLSKPKTNVNYTDNHNFSALHHAVVIRNVAIIKLLLGHKKIDTRILTHEGYSVLYLACSSESMSAEIVELILKRDATLVHLCNKQEQSPLQVAITRERLELVTMLVKFGASVNHKDVDGETSLHYAASCANYGIVEFLLDAGADPTINSNEELNPLCLLLVRTSIERDEQLVFSCFQLLFSRTYVKDVETDTYNISDIFRPTFLSSAFSSNSIASYLIHNTYNKNNSMYWMIQKLEEQSMNLLDPNEFRSYINIFLHDKIRRYDDFKFSRFYEIDSVMNHRAVAYSLKCCIAANDLDSLAIQLMEHLDRISFDLKSKTFSATLGGALFGTYITPTVSLDEFKRLYQLVEQFHGRIFDIEVILKSYVHAVAITALNAVSLTNVWQILKILLPFCTTFFSDQTLWSEIHSYYRLNGVFHEIVRGLLDRYGNKKNYEKIPYCEFKIYSLRHLARNEVRASVMKNSSESQEFVRNIMGLEIPFVLRQYLRFQDNDPPVLY